MVEETTTGHYQDEDTKQFYEHESLNAEGIGYIVLFMTFMLIVLLVCITGLAVTSRCCQGSEVKLVSNSYRNSRYVTGGVNDKYAEGGREEIRRISEEEEGVSESRV